MIDFKENIELLEKVILNFILMDDNNETLIRPKNVEALDIREVIPKMKTQYFNNDDLGNIFKVVKNYYKEYQNLGGIIIEPPIGYGDPHKDKPIYKKIVNKIIGQIK